MDEQPAPVLEVMPSKSNKARILFWVIFLFVAAGVLSVSYSGERLSRIFFRPKYLVNCSPFVAFENIKTGEVKRCEGTGVVEVPKGWGHRIESPPYEDPRKVEVEPTGTANGWNEYKYAYEGIEYGFTFKYPNDFQLTQIKTEHGLVVESFKNGNSIYHVFDDKPNFSLSFSIDDSDFSQPSPSSTFEEICSEYEYMYPSQDGGAKLLSCERVTINGREFVRIVTEFEKGEKQIKLHYEADREYFIADSYIPAGINQEANIPKIEEIYKTIELI